ncbi:hypothetical protein WN944_027450 [Citrus x changshan-huyou]|uniref:non-specific serine/threonine protein kinase n=1 Tax=Citrus x changshan-huyou TaxID=2935761 RepID=A0AAP0Q974_9ROSI
MSYIKLREAESPHNNPSNFIPRCFEEMHWLSRIDISYNVLQGPIPDSTTFRDAPMKALQGNKRLCGDIRGFPSCKVFNSRRTAHKHNRVALDILPGCFQC